MRGTYGIAAPLPGRTRFIPACAGNMWRRGTAAIYRTVHPRVCGEHQAGVYFFQRYHGSSPRVRGTLAIPCSQSHRRRFIPACAGNIVLPNIRPTRNAVHPRVCGEHVKGTATIKSYCGSSPRVRGTFAPHSLIFEKIRFIPACAGNIYQLGTLMDARAVHPRVCGEHVAVLLLRSSQRGSSPRVRGTSH